MTVLTKHRLAAFDSSDKSRRVREEVLNSLEAFTYRSRDYLEDESFIGASTSAVRSTLEKALSAASEWIYSEGAEANEKSLRSKLKELEEIVNPVIKRKDESSKRPDAIKELKDTLAHIREVEQLVDGQIKTQSAESSKSSEAVSAASAASSASPSADPMDDLDEETESSASAPAEPEITEVPTIYTASDLKTVQDVASKAQQWLDDAEVKQSKLTETDDPAFTVKDIQAEKKKLDDVVMDMMMKKMKHFKPPTQSKTKTSSKPKAKSTKAKKNASKTNKSTSKETEKPEAAEHPHSEPEDPKSPSQEELDEALRKAGVKADNVKLKNMGQKDEMVDEKGRKLKKLNMEKDATQEDIQAAIDEALKGAKEKKEGHSEL
jgi:hypoxia up-regulated 1